MDKASAYGAGDCRFESYRDCLDTLLMTNDIKKRGYHLTTMLVREDGKSLADFVVGVHELSML